MGFSFEKQKFRFPQHVLHNTPLSIVHVRLLAREIYNLYTYMYEYILCLYKSSKTSRRRFIYLENMPSTFGWAILHRNLFWKVDRTCFEQIYLMHFIFSKQRNFFLISFSTVKSPSQQTDGPRENDTWWVNIIHYQEPYYFMQRTMRIQMSLFEFRIFTAHI